MLSYEYIICMCFSDTINKNICFLYDFIKYIAGLNGLYILVFMVTLLMKLLDLH